MKNTIISLTIFSILLSIVFFFDIKLNSVCDQILNSCEEIETELNKNNWEISYDESINLRNILNENYISLSLYINHEQLDNLSKEILSLTQYVKTKDISNALSSVHIIKVYTTHLKDIQKVNIGNILISNLKNIILLWNLY